MQRIERPVSSIPFSVSYRLNGGRTYGEHANTSALADMLSGRMAAAVPTECMSVFQCESSTEPKWKSYCICEYIPPFCSVARISRAHIRTHWPTSQYITAW